MSSAMFGRDTDRRNVSGVIWLKQANHEADHGPGLRNYSISQSFRGCQQIFERVSAVSLAVNKASLIESPALIKLRYAQRPHVITKIRSHRHDVVDASAVFERSFRSRVQPASSNFLQYSH